LGEDEVVRSWTVVDKRHEPTVDPEVGPSARPVAGCPSVDLEIVPVK
jgi:hypothetical protein